VGPKRDRLSLVGTTEELLGRKNSGSGLEKREYGRGDPLRGSCGDLYPHKLALTSLTRGGLSHGKDGSRTKATEYVCLLQWYVCSSTQRIHLPV
jgi:hypothetical protein